MADVSHSQAHSQSRSQPSEKSYKMLLWKLVSSFAGHQFRVKCFTADTTVHNFVQPTTRHTRRPVTNYRLNDQRSHYA